MRGNPTLINQVYQLLTKLTFHAFQKMSESDLDEVDVREVYGKNLVKHLITPKYVQLQFTYIQLQLTYTC